jgi:hypothetical protein
MIGVRLSNTSKPRRVGRTFGLISVVRSSSSSSCSTPPSFPTPCCLFSSVGSSRGVPLGACPSSCILCLSPSVLCCGCSSFAGCASFLVSLCSVFLVSSASFSRLLSEPTLLPAFSNRSAFSLLLSSLLIRSLLLSTVGLSTLVSFAAPTSIFSFDGRNVSLGVMSPGLSFSELCLSFVGLV